MLLLSFPDRPATKKKKRITTEAQRHRGVEKQKKKQQKNMPLRAHYERSAEPHIPLQPNLA